jgi:hypothetical protein
MHVSSWITVHELLLTGVGVGLGLTHCLLGHLLRLKDLIESTFSPGILHILLDSQVDVDVATNLLNCHALGVFG